MHAQRPWVPLVGLLLAFGSVHAPARASDRETPRTLQRLKYNHPELVVDLGVGLWAWPIPIDFDNDGDLDLVVSCPDVPANGLYCFENPDGNTKLPVFRPARQVSAGAPNVMPSYLGDEVRVLMPAQEVVNLRQSGLNKTRKLPAPSNVHANKVRANQWRYADYDGDNKLDLIVGVGDWKEYGWDNAFNAQGQWMRGPLRGYVYLLRNRGTAEDPLYAEAEKIKAGGRPIDTYGMPSPNLADFDGDGDLDILCGEFVDRFTYFENTGTLTEPRYAAGRLLMHGGKLLRMDLCMIVPVAIDWDRDGDVDLVVGQEDGRVALMENTAAVVDRMPEFLPPRFFRQVADDVKFGALVTPSGFDWDGDGDDDLICGNTAGYIGLIENLDGACPPRLAAPRYLQAEGRPIRIEAGDNGSIQGPCEAKWGYTTLTVADWDHDELPDLVVNSIWGKIVWYRNIGARSAPKLAAARPIEVDYPGKSSKPAWTWWEPEGKSLVTQWRTTPMAFDWNEDGLCDLVMLDQEGYLALFQRRRQEGQLVLMPPQRVFVDRDGQPLQLSGGSAGASGRRKLCLVDWDRDGRTDLLVNSRNIDFLRNLGTADGKTTLANQGAVSDRRLAGHSSSPTVVDWDADRTPDLVVGAEDGHLYYMQNPRARKARDGRAVRRLHRAAPGNYNR